MKPKFTAIAIATCLMFSSSVKADEGMWLLPLLEKLNISTMRDMGCELTADEIFSIDSTSLKDAIVIFGGGCTGEIVSEKGLIFTNHHCGYSSIQQLSSVEHNYLRDGFWAKSHSEELPVEGLSVKFLRKMEDVTCRMLEGITDDMSEVERDEILDKNRNDIVIEYSNGNEYMVDVEEYYAGNMYYVVAYEVFTDVRLVGTPPESIGKFGHDTDNWMWPRHTGDFSIFRVYTNKEGKPAKYSADNIPMATKRFLPISIGGYKPDDFTFIMGYPGSTDRYLSSWGVNMRMDAINSAMIHVRGVKQKIWLADMQADETVNIQYASKYSSSSNYWKNSIGMNNGIEKLNVVERKREEEAAFAKWVNADAARKAKYGTLLVDIQKNYDEYMPYVLHYSYFTECFLRGVEICRFASGFMSFEKLNALNKQTLIRNFKNQADAFYKNYSVSTDKKVFEAMLDFYHNVCELTYYTFLTEEELEKHGSDYSNYVDDLFSRSMFTNKERLYAFLDDPQLSELQDDPIYKVSKEIVNQFAWIQNDCDSVETALTKNLRLQMQALMEMNEGKKVMYPDANFTMRLTYGKVNGYSPSDAVTYNYYTTLKGVMEKEDSTDWEFVVSPKLKELYAESDYGRYVDADSTMHVCFVANLDITGGNSGSPVLDGKGRLLGLAFDGNWEAMSGDIVFEKDIQRCVAVDIRYVLFIIEKYAGALNIINELKIEE